MAISVTAISAGIISLRTVTIPTNVKLLSVHANEIRRIEALQSLTHLRVLDLSANAISIIEGLDGLISLESLNLSSNLISKVENLRSLHCLKYLNLSYNRIRDISGLLDISGDTYSLTILLLHGNKLSSMNAVMNHTRKLSNLEHLVLSFQGSTNPMCFEAGYWKRFLENIPTLHSLDCREHSGVFQKSLEQTVIYPDIATYLEAAIVDLSSESEGPQLETSNTDRVLQRHQEREEALRTSHQADTSTISPNSATPSTHSSVRSNHRVSDCEKRIAQLEGMLQQQAAKQEQDISRERQKAVSATARVVETKSREDAESTFNKLLTELNQEREARWKAETAVKQIVARARSDQTAAAQHDPEASAALERACANAKAEAQLERTARQRADEETLEVRHQLEKLKIAYDERERVFAEATQETKASHRRQKDAAAAALQRERVARAEVERHCEHARRLLDEQTVEHRRQMAFNPTQSADFQTALQNEMAKYKDIFDEKLKFEKSKAEELAGKYRDLENEFREALHIEADRQRQLEATVEREAANHTAASSELNAVRAKAEERAELLAELNGLCRELKARLSEAQRGHGERVADMQSRLTQTMSDLGEQKRRADALEGARQDKGKLLAQVTACESVIAGLRAERQNWSKELATQGVSLAQDRGRLESKIETLQAELKSAKKDLALETETVKSKTAVICEQTETLRKLKAALLERDLEIKRQREGDVERQRSWEEGLQERDEKIFRLEARAEDAERRVVEMREKANELEEKLEKEVRVNLDLATQWEDRSNTLTKLEEQMDSLASSAASKETALKADVAQLTAQLEELRGRFKVADDAFRSQLDAERSERRRSLEEARAARGEEMRAAQSRVAEVEGEMRSLLDEVETERCQWKARMASAAAIFSNAA